jgi:NAD-dependent dihydropyrimidine dehydrogenase PreA subunit
MRKNIVNTLKYDRGKCTGCGRCIEVCPHGVFEMAERNGKKRARLVARKACMECGACRMNCPSGAIEVDSGVGCAWAMFRAALLPGEQEVCCGPKTEKSCESKKSDCNEP